MPEPDSLLDAVASAAWRAGLPAGDAAGASLAAVLRDAADPRTPVAAVIGTALDGEPLVATRAAAATQRAAAVVAGLRAAARATGAPRALLLLPAPAGGGAAAVALGAAVRAALAEAPPSPSDRHGPPVELLERAPFAGCADALVLADALDFPAAHAPLGPGAVRWRDARGPGAAATPPLVLGADVLAALGAALAGAPLLRRTVSVAGAVERPGLYDVPLGTPLAWLADAAGARPGAALVAGAGPASGRRVTAAGSASLGGVPSAADALAPHDAALIVLPPGAAPAHDLARFRSACSGCARCTDLCPHALLGLPLAPHLLAGAAHCSGCGLCTIICPAGLRPHALLSATAGATAAAAARAPRAPRAPDPARAGRRVPLDAVALRLGLHRFDAPDPRAAAVPVRPPRLLLALDGAHLRLALAAPGPVEAAALLAEAPPGSRAARVHAPLAGEVRWHGSDPHTLVLHAS